MLIGVLILLFVGGLILSGYPGVAASVFFVGFCYLVVSGILICVHLFTKK